MEYQSYLDKGSSKTLQVIKLIFYTLFLVFCLLGSQLIAAVIINDSTGQAEEYLEIIKIFYTSIYLEPLFILLVLFCLYYLRKYDFSRANRVKISWKRFFKIVIGFVFVIFILEYLLSFVSPSTAENQKLLELIFSYGQNKLLFFISVVIFAPLMEELFFRKWLVGFLGHFNLLMVLVSAILFTFVHDADSITSALPYFILGLIIGFSYSYTRDFRVPLAIHSLNNLIAFISLYSL